MTRVIQLQGLMSALEVRLELFRLMIEHDKNIIRELDTVVEALLEHYGLECTDAGPELRDKEEEEKR